MNVLLFETRWVKRMLFCFRQMSCAFIMLACSDNAHRIVLTHWRYNWAFGSATGGCQGNGFFFSQSLNWSSNRSIEIPESSSGKKLRLSAGFLRKCATLSRDNCAGCGICAGTVHCAGKLGALGIRTFVVVVKHRSHVKQAIASFFPLRLYRCIMVTLVRHWTESERGRFTVKTFSK